MNAVVPRLRVHGVAAVKDFHPRLYQLLLGQNGKEPGIVAHPEAVILFRPPCRVGTVQPVGGVFVLRAHGNGQPEQLLRQSEGNLMTNAVAQREVNGDQSRRSQAAQNVLLFQQNHPFSQPCRRQCCGNSAETAAADQHVAAVQNRYFLHRFTPGKWAPGRHAPPCISRTASHKVHGSPGLA